MENNTTPANPKPTRSTLAAVAIGIIFLMALGTLVIAWTISIDRHVQGTPGDGVISMAEWNNFVTKQVKTVTQGGHLSPEAT